MNEQTEQWRYFRSLLQTNYQFRELAIVRHEAPIIIQTDRGLKKIRVWNDAALLKKHLILRRELVNGAFFIDRMYATQSGALMIPNGPLSITCHDVSLEDPVYSGNERIWAEVLNQIMTKSRAPYSESVWGSTAEAADEMIQQLEQSETLTGSAGRLASACYAAASARARQTDQLRRRYEQDRRLFVLPADFSFQGCRSLMDTLFVEFGQERFIPGYRAAAQFFFAWLSESGEESLEQLFKHLKAYSMLNRQMLDLIRAEWLEPAEWFALMMQLADHSADEPEIKLFKKIWNQKTQLIRLFDAIFASS